mmetsp:Transcript_52442/g.147176  ORF Transcript_52442/g.147176 Transcript_52442/m.147176 type:complete len:307 (-) Transcript_52442:38-958(-)
MVRRTVGDGHADARGGVLHSALFRLVAQRCPRHFGAVLGGPSRVGHIEHHVAEVSRDLESRALLGVGRRHRPAREYETVCKQPLLCGVLLEVLARIFQQVVGALHLRAPRRQGPARLGHIRDVPLRRILARRRGEVVGLGGSERLVHRLGIGCHASAPEAHLGVGLAHAASVPLSLALRRRRRLRHHPPHGRQHDRLLLRPLRRRGAVGVCSLSGGSRRDLGRGGLRLLVPLGGRVDHVRGPRLRRHLRPGAQGEGLAGHRGRGGPLRQEPVNGGPRAHAQRRRDRMAPPAMRWHSMLRVSTCARV